MRRANETSLPPARRIMLFTEDDIRAVAKDLASGAEDSVPPDDGVQDEPTNNDAKGKDSSKPSPKSPSNNRNGRRRLSECVPDNVLIEPVVHVLDESELPCSCCGEMRCEIGREVSQQLEYVPASLKVVQHERVRYACPACEEHVAIVARPPQPIEKGLPGAGLLAHTVLLYVARVDVRFRLTRSRRRRRL